MNIKMPPKKYSKTKRTTKRKVYPKRKTQNSKGLIKLIKNISLKTQETKIATADSGVLQFYHNTSQVVRGNLFTTTQGITDSTGTANRLGDTVTPVGLKLYFTLRQPADRPNVTWKFWILKIWGNVTPPTFVPVKNITGNLMMDPIDTEKATIVKVLTYKAPDNYWAGSLAASKEMVMFRKVYIPCARTPYVYGADNTAAGKKFQMTMYGAAYDTFGTLITDNIASMAVCQVFYFKDA